METLVASKAGRLDFAELAALGMAVGLTGLGALSIVSHDFAEVWQPVPKSFPAYATSAIISGLILVAAGVMLAMRRTRAWGSALAAAFLGLWVLGLHLPNAIAKPLVVGSWQAVCEPLAMTAGAFIAWRQTQTRGPDRASHAAMLVMGVCFMVFGASHFVYAQFTTQMVPAFLPFRSGLTYLTGAIHVGTGLCLLAGIRRRWAAVVEALMMTSFVVLVHIPRAVGAPHDRMETTGLFIATTLSSAAWILAASLLPPRLAR
jgi:uncharacterized membrane protein